jgi:hypothetical protein
VKNSDCRKEHKQRETKVSSDSLNRLGSTTIEGSEDRDSRQGARPAKVLLDVSKYKHNKSLRSLRLCEKYIAIQQPFERQSKLSLAEAQGTQGFKQKTFAPLAPWREQKTGTSHHVRVFHIVCRP